MADKRRVAIGKLSENSRVKPLNKTEIVLVFLNVTS